MLASLAGSMHAKSNFNDKINTLIDKLCTTNEKICSLVPPCKPIVITQDDFVGGVGGVYTIASTDPAGTYCLETNVVGQICIEQEQVTLDLNNRNVDGNDEDAIVIKASCVTVQNGSIKQLGMYYSGPYGITQEDFTPIEDIALLNLTIDGYETGICFDQIKNLVIDNVHSSNNLDHGLLIDGQCDAGDGDHNANHITVLNSSFNDNGSPNDADGIDSGIRMTGAQSVVLKNCLTNGNLNGIYLNICKDVCIIDCSAKANTENGLFVTNENYTYPYCRGTENLLVDGFNAIGNMQSGAEIENVLGALICRSNFLNNGDHGLHITGDDTENVMVAECKAEGNTRAGFWNDAEMYCAYNEQAVFAKNIACDNMPNYSCIEAVVEQGGIELAGNNVACTLP